MFLYFNIINNISIFNSEIEGFTAPYGYSLFEYTIGSMVNCVAGIACSIYVGKLLDKYRNYKAMQIYVGIACFLALLLTYLILEFNLPNFLGIAMSILGGGPVSSISCVSYQFAAEVSYPVSEVQSVSLMNIVSKLLTFGFSQLTNILVIDDATDKNFRHGFFLWMGVALVALIPAFLV